MTGIWTVTKLGVRSVMPCGRISLSFGMNYVQLKCHGWRTLQCRIFTDVSRNDIYV